MALPASWLSPSFYAGKVYMEPNLNSGMRQAAERSLKTSTSASAASFFDQAAHQQRKMQQVARLRQMNLQADHVAEKLNLRVQRSLSSQQLLLRRRATSAATLRRPAAMANPFIVPAAEPVRMATPEPMYVAPKLTADEEWKKRQELRKVLAMAEEGLNSRFSDMFKAFQYVDLDRSGRLSRSEIRRALDMWNVPLDDSMLDLLLGDCDQDGDGGVSYEEFVDKLARGTVSNAAMGKRGLQSKEAMGVDAQEMLHQQLGHKTAAEKAKERSFRISING